jgi:hypothetical protein
VFADIQAAVDAASGGETIKVAAGKYTGVQGRSAPPGYVGSSVVTQVVHIDKNITVRGGYTPTDWTISSPVPYRTTVDAQGQGRAIFIAGDIAPSIRGLFITGGDAAWLGGTYSRVDWQGAGGGVYIMNAAATLEGNWISGNTARFGGGVYLYYSDATLRDNTITQNSSEWLWPQWPGYGGGLYLYKSDATISSNAIMSNTTDYAGGGVCMVESDALLYGNTVSHNIAAEGEEEGEGGGICLYCSEATLVGNTIFDNAVVADPISYGGGVFSLRSNLTIEANTIVSNTASAGGGLAFVEGSGDLASNIVAENSADLGSGLYVEDAPLSMWHGTVARNRGAGAGAYVTGGLTAALTNTIIVSNTVGVRAASGNTITLEATLWGTATWANETDWTTSGTGTVVTGTIDLRGDPGFVSLDARDYRIDSSSDAIDAGMDSSIATDVELQPRPYQSPDLGADEYWPPGTLKQVYLPLMTADLP